MFRHFTSARAEPYNTSKSPGRSTHRGKSTILDALPHIKYYVLVKHVAVILYMLREIHTNLTLDVLCYNSGEAEDGGIPRVKICLRPSCMWLHWIVLRLPRWFELPETMCTGLLFGTLISAILVLLSLYIRELESTIMLRSTHLFKIIITMPSVLIELIFTVLMCYSAVAGAYHWSRFSVPKWSGVLAVIYAFLVVVAVIIQLSLHLVAVAYVCRRRCPRKPVDVQVDCRFDTSSVDSPTSTVLAMLKYQDEAERLAVTTDLPSAGLARSADSSTRICSVPPLDISSLNNNGPSSKQLVTPSPCKTNSLESPPYARLRTPTAFQFANQSVCAANVSPFKSFDLHRPRVVDYNRAYSSDRCKTSQISPSVAVVRLPTTSINEEYSIPEVSYDGK